MRTNRNITVYKKVKASGSTVFRLLFSCPAFASGVVKSDFSRVGVKGSATADDYTVRIPLKNVSSDISKGDRVIINGTDLKGEYTDSELTQLKALTVISVKINDTCSSYLAHIRLECER